MTTTKDTVCRHCDTLIYRTDAGGWLHRNGHFKGCADCNNVAEPLATKDTFADGNCLCNSGHNDAERECREKHERERVTEGLEECCDYQYPNGPCNWPPSCHKKITPASNHAFVPSGRYHWPKGTEATEDTFKEAKRGYAGGSMNYTVTFRYANKAVRCDGLGPDRVCELYFESEIEAVNAASALKNATNTDEVNIYSNA